MVDKIGFFTAVKYQQPQKTGAQSLLQKVDNYFYLGGKKAHVLQGKIKNGKETVILTETNSSILARVAKAVSYLSIILPLILLLAKAILRSQHTYRLLDPKRKLEKGIQIPQTTVAKIQSLMPKILGQQKDEKLQWLSTGNYLVFKLPEHPDLVFKIAKPNCFGRDKLPTGGKEKTDRRFANMIKAKEICIANQLGLMVVPHSKKITLRAEGHEYALIAEERLDFNPKQSAQEELYQTLSKELNPTLRQLATFIAKTGFNDVIWRNIPLLNEPAGHQGPKRVGLIDIEHLENKVNGFVGDWNGSCGLIRCVAADQIDLVASEAGKQGVDLSKSLQQTKNLRLKELQSAKELKQFYQKRGIQMGNEPIAIDDRLLDFSQYPDPVGLKQLATHLIQEINNQIARSSPKEAVKGRRSIYINPNPPESPFYAKSSRLLDRNINPYDHNAFKTDEDYHNATYLGCVVNKLIELEAIFKLIKRNGHGYFIQA